MFPLGNFLFYLGANIGGIAYVNVSNLSNYRRNPMLNKLASYSTLVWTVAFTPIFFLISVMIVLRSTHSRSSNACVSTDCNYVIYSQLDCFVYNVAVWGSGFATGLCFTYFKLFKLQLNLVPKQMKTWPLVNWLVFFGGLAVSFSIIVTILYYYHQSGVLLNYIVVVILILAALFIPAVVLRRSRHLHIHHYTIGMIFLTLIAYPIYPLAWLSGLFNGFMIEGGTTYAYDPIFPRRKP